MPILNWFVYGSISVLSSVIVYLLYKYIIIKDQTYFKRSTKLHEKISYTLSLIFSILLVCFMLGLFKYNAISILSNSMQPVFSRGDVIVYKQFTEKDINLITPNTIIIYSLGDQYIAHRVINVIKENNNIYFQTKGDNNNTPDFFKVKIEQIKGIYAFHIKYLGFPSVWLHDYLISDIPLVQSP